MTDELYQFLACDYYGTGEGKNPPALYFFLYKMSDLM
jgi:hypothetical protein